MSKEPLNEKVMTEADIEAAKKERADGSSDLLTSLVGYSKRYNGYPYVSASRIEHIPGKDEKASILFQQILGTYLVKNVKDPKAMEDFVETFGRGDLVYIQAHTDCPTMCTDGLYNSVNINGEAIKTILIGYFKLVPEDPTGTKDPEAMPGYNYYYQNQDGEFIDLFINEGVPLTEYYNKYTILFKREKKIPFTPIIVRSTNKDGKKAYGLITGDPFHGLTTAEIAAILKDQADRGNLKAGEQPAVQEAEQK